MTVHEHSERCCCCSCCPNMQKPHVYPPLTIAHTSIRKPVKKSKPIQNQKKHSFCAIESSYGSWLEQHKENIENTNNSAIGQQNLRNRQKEQERRIKAMEKTLSRGKDEEKRKEEEARKAALRKEQIAAMEERFQDEWYLHQLQTAADADPKYAMKLEQAKKRHRKKKQKKIRIQMGMQLPDHAYKPPFLPYGGWNTDPVNGGIVYGNYMTSYNILPQTYPNDPEVPWEQVYTSARRRARQEGIYPLPDHDL